MKKRIWELANQLGMKSKKLLKIAQMQGMKVANVLNILEEDEIQKLLDCVSRIPSQERETSEEQDNEMVGEEKLLEDVTSQKDAINTLPQNVEEENQKIAANATFVDPNKDAFSEIKEKTAKQESMPLAEKPLLEEKNLELRLNEDSKVEQRDLPINTDLIQKTEISHNSSVPNALETYNIPSHKNQAATFVENSDSKSQQTKEKRLKDTQGIDLDSASYHASIQDRINMITQGQNRNSQSQTQNQSQNQNRNPQNQNRTAQNQSQNRNSQNQAQNQNQNRNSQNQNQNRNSQNQNQNQNRNSQNQNRTPQNQNRTPQNQSQNRNLQAQNQQEQSQNRNIQNQNRSQQSQNSQNQNRGVDSLEIQNANVENVQNSPKETKQDQTRKEQNKAVSNKNHWVIRENRLEQKGKKISEESDLSPESGSESDKKLESSQEKDKKISVTSTSKQRTIEITVPISIKDFSQTIGVRASSILQKLFDGNRNTLFNVNSVLNDSMVETLALEFEKDIKIKKEENQEEMLLKELAKEDAPEDLIPRSPVVTFMGHVDHGKTSLLDSIRKTNVAAGEAGGITQYIGASKVDYANQSIVFLDTPGHEAFTAMRARGANITDIVVLVVAGDDGVMPQTIEAINHAKAANVPIIVAINKMDKPNARPDAVMQQLARHNLICEQWHGDVICVEVSAVTKKGINTLLDYILLVAEMQELKANPKRKASGTVLDARIVEGKGEVASLLVQNGTLKQGDTILCGKHYGRVREITMRESTSSDYKKIKQAGPSMPVEVCGLSGLPEAGDKFSVLDSLSIARNMAETRQKNVREQSLANTTRKFTLEEILKELQEGTSKELRVVLKADVQGSLEALNAKVTEIKHEEIKVKLLHSAVGPINERDIQLADASRALIIGFNVSANKAARDMAEEKKIEIRKYNVIYHVLEDIKKIMSGMLAPKISEEVSGHISIRKVIHISKVGNIAGCYVTDGVIERNSKIRLYRNGIMVNKEKPLEISTLKHFKEDVGKVKAGFECGLKLEGFDDIKEGDELEAFKLVKSERYLD